VSGESVCVAGPSLALVKYWGKSLNGENLPATPSLAVTLGGVRTLTRVSLAEEDSVAVNGAPQDIARFAPFFTAARRALGTEARFAARSENDFPSAAGLASSSSGFAALAGACAAAAGLTPSLADLSALARAGSASAARAVFGGFVLLPAGARRARAVAGPEHWPDLRIVVAITTVGPKPISSRAAMESTRAGSPYYFSWIKKSVDLLPDALTALERRDLELLGATAVRSYSLMHGAILGARPPVLYWLPATVALIHECAAMRADGISAWETIDAGPQVKILCLEKDAPAVARRATDLGFGIRTVICHPGPGLRYGEP
jgi:diphosphomevalonate decarboxylase